MQFTGLLHCWLVHSVLIIMVMIPAVFIDVPIHIIMEYACHGSLKKYLDKCRQAVLQYKELLCISTVNNGKNIAKQFIQLEDTWNPSILDTLGQIKVSWLERCLHFSE